jgi:hypothetical protein
MIWSESSTAQRVTAIIPLLIDGSTYTQIAEALNTSREAVAGLIHRARERNELPRTVAAVDKTKGGRATAKRRKVERKKAKPRHAGITNYVALGAPLPPSDIKPLKSNAWKALPGSVPVPLEQRTGCAWPLGDGPFLFCNEPVQEGKSWCPHHFTLGNRPIPTAPRRKPTRA